MRTAARLVFLLTVGACFLPASLGHAQSSYKANDRIEVLFLNKWYPVVVVSTNQRGEVLAEFEFIAGRPRRELFKQDAVRAEYESNAIARGRIWSDTTGSFKIKAALLAANDKEVTLRKQDLTELTVPLDKLSEPDKAY